MTPERVDEERVAKQGDDAVLARPTEEENASTQGGLQVELPPGGKGTPRRCRLEAATGAVTARGHVVASVLAERVQRALAKAGPDLRLPAWYTTGLSAHGITSRGLRFRL